MIRPVADSRALFVADLRTNQGRVVLRVNPANGFLRGCDWAANDRVLCTVYRYPELRRRKTVPPQGYSKPMWTVVRLVAVNPDGTGWLELVPKPTRAPRHGILGVDWGYNDKEHRVLAYLGGRRRPGVPAAGRCIQRLRLSGECPHQRDGAVQSPVPGITEWSADAAGVVRLGMGSYSLPYFGETDRKNAFASPKAVVVESGRQTVVPIPHLGAPAFVPRVLGYNERNGSAYVEAVANGGDRIGVWEVDARTLAILRPLVAHPERDAVATPIRGASCGLVGLGHLGLDPQRFTWLDDSFGSAMKQAETRIPGNLVAIESMSKDCARVILAVSGEDQSIALPRLDGRVVSSQPLRYRARDGTVIDARITLPPVAKVALPPVVVYPLHGLPGRNAVFDPWTQFLVDRGYAVFRPLVRGSLGRGTRHMLAGFEQNSRVLQDDFADGIAWLADQGIADARAVCYVGQGMGGFLALVGAAGDESNARCAAHFAFSTLANDRLNAHETPSLHRHEFVWDWWSRREPRLFRRGNGPWGFVETSEERRRLASMRSPLHKAKHPGYSILLDTPNHPHQAYSGQSRRYGRAMSEAAKLFHTIPEGGPRQRTFLRNLASFLENELRSRD
ncbi:MAG: prolyl oligopeptidase family serine peptidase [Gammaproteobacteria bacterium]|nr:prolyl oligopeptidase family serine peptidase [Gammaproteobacteria bacterium]